MERDDFGPEEQGSMNAPCSRNMGGNAVRTLMSDQTHASVHHLISMRAYVDDLGIGSFFRIFL